MVTNRHIQEINAILGKLTEEFNKNKNAREKKIKKRNKRSFNYKRTPY